MSNPKPKGLPDTVEVDGVIRFSRRYFKRQLKASDIAEGPFSKDLPNLYYIAENTFAPDSSMRMLMEAAGIEA